jgi:GT2 family glycosyltransferase
VTARHGDDALPEPAGPIEGVAAIVVTHRRRRLAGDVVRSLLNVERFDPAHVVVVVSGEGGLDDPDLEDRVQMRRLPTNVGPAAAFRHGLVDVFSDPSVQWAYLCEDDIGLFNLPAPRVVNALARVSAVADGDIPIGALVSYGRTFTPHGGHTRNLVPENADGPLVPVDVACWGATLVSRAVVDAGVLPDPAWFFGYEDFDFFCRLRAAGFSVVVDATAARAVADQQTGTGRADALSPHRPVDADEAWRAYYVARNFFTFARRHGTASWFVWHLVYSVRRLQLAGSWAERRAYLHGLWDGSLGRLGSNPRYQSRSGELAVPGSDAVDAGASP